MSQSNFESMNKADLRAYVLAHPEDQAGFYALVDRLHAEPNQPSGTAIATLDQLPEVQRAQQQAKQRVQQRLREQGTSWGNPNE
ncbi:MAG: hypothetical protein MUF49_05890 [Oculatellaceae cyanobacterium Prado106]|jgi:hypothetical protein|nr:hypothetical protein [Oculatellaceae cyanobacterium Prado106]